MLAGLAERTRETFPNDPAATHLDYVELWQASGKTLNQLAAELSAGTESKGADADPLPVSGEMISRYLYKTFDEKQGDERLTRARARGSYRLLDETVSIADNVKAKDEVPAARLQVSARQFVLEKWNPAEFGQSRGTNITLNVSQLHLQALQARPTQAIPAEKVTAALLGAGNNFKALDEASLQVVRAAIVRELE